MPLVTSTASILMRLRGEIMVYAERFGVIANVAQNRPSLLYGLEREPPKASRAAA